MHQWQSLDLASWTYWFPNRSASVKYTFVLEFRVHVESLTMSSQEPPKKKSKQDDELFCLYSECKCVDVMYFVPVCTNAYHMEKHKTYNGFQPGKKSLYKSACAIFK